MLASHLLLFQAPTLLVLVLGDRRAAPGRLPARLFTVARPCRPQVQGFALLGHQVGPGFGGRTPEVLLHGQLL